MYLLLLGDCCRVEWHKPHNCHNRRTAAVGGLDAVFLPHTPLQALCQQQAAAAHLRHQVTCLSVVAHGCVARNIVAAVTMSATAGCNLVAAIWWQRCGADVQLACSQAASTPFLPRRITLGVRAMHERLEKHQSCARVPPWLISFQSQ